MVSTLSFLEPSVQSVKKQIASTPEIPFLNLISSIDWQRLLDEEGVQYRERVFSPFVTLWAFVCQVLNADHSCRSAVAQWIAACIGQGQTACSSLTSAYCRARQRLPEGLYRRVALHLGEKLDSQSPSQWKWKGRDVKIVDGTMLKLQDTRENQKEYPQRNGQAPGLGFPTLRLLVVVSLSNGALLNAAFSALEGKENGETALLRSLISTFHPRDVLLFDRLYTGYFNLAFFMHYGVDFVARQHQTRNQYSMTEVKRLSTRERIVAVRRPFYNHFKLENCPLDYDEFPPAILLREISFRVQRRGFRTRHFRVITNLINPAEYSTEDILRLYAARWNVETDILNLKIRLEMEELRCKSPEMVRKEIWAHLMAYNFVRLAAAQAAQISDQTPRSISFEGTLQLLMAFRPVLYATRRSPSRWRNSYRQMLEQISKQRVGNRPGRYEPRVLKRRNPNTYPFLTTSRSKARKSSLLTKKGHSNQYAKFARP